MKNYNQKYWKEQYYNRENIKQWYKDFKTYYSILPDEKTCKKDFLLSEKREIETIIIDKQEQIKIYNFVEKTLQEV